LRIQLIVILCALIVPSFVCRVGVDEEIEGLSHNGMRSVSTYNNFYLKIVFSILSRKISIA